MKAYLELLNQLFSLENKLAKDNRMDQYGKHIQRMKQSLNDLGYIYHDPINEKYTETRTDLEANIAGEAGKNMIVTQVIKPIVFHQNQIVQQGIVIVENK